MDRTQLLLASTFTCSALLSHLASFPTAAVLFPDKAGNRVKFTAVTADDRREVAVRVASWWTLTYAVMLSLTTLLVVGAYLVAAVPPRNTAVAVTATLAAAWAVLSTVAYLVSTGVASVMYDVSTDPRYVALLCYVGGAAVMACTTLFFVAKALLPPAFFF